MGNDRDDRTLAEQGAEPNTVRVGSGGPRSQRSEKPQDRDDVQDLVQVAPDHYTLGREIAAGGMGRIFEARDHRLGRIVAIKQLLSRSADLRARFEREARITAQLQHPNIVNVIEAGRWTDGEPFFAMKLVAGESLDKAIRRKATLGERMALLPNVIAATEALAYAHNMHVIHRDLKPANVLVGDFGETVVIDWGLAKELSDGVDDRGQQGDGPYRREEARPGETEIGDVMGTPGFMSLERARGEPVDARCDVYALGAMLYHVLAGQAPYHARGTKPILADVLAAPPPSLATLVTGVPPDLLAIVDKAMARDHKQRYADARDLADDLKRFQTGQLVGAHQYTTRQLVARWLRRHRAPVAITAIAVVVLAALGAIGVRRIIEEQTRTEVAREDAAKHREQLEDLLGFMLGDLRDKLKPLGKLDLLASVARKAGSYYADSAGSAPEARRRRAQALGQIADVLADQGDLPGALTQRLAALAIAETLVATNPDERAQRGLLAALRAVADVQRMQGSLEPAFATARRATALADSLATSTSRDVRVERAAAHTALGHVLDAHGEAKVALVEHRLARTLLEAMVAEGASSAQDQISLANSRLAAGKLLSEDLGDVATAVDEYRAALAIQLRLSDAERTNTELRREVGVGHNRLGRVLEQQGKLADALAEYRAAHAIADVLAATDPSNAPWQHDVAVVDEAIARALRLSGDLAGALASQRSATARVQQLADRDPSNVTWQTDLAQHHMKLGELLRQLGDLDGALVEHRLELAISTAVLGKDPSHALARRHVTIAQVKLGDMLLAKGDKAGALAQYEASVDSSEKLMRVDSSSAAALRDVSVAYEKLGDVQLATGDTKGATASQRKTLDIARALAAKDPKNAGAQRDIMISLEKVGDTLAAARDLTGALATYREELAVCQALFDKDPSNLRALDDLAYCHMKVGDALLATGHTREAIDALSASLALREKHIAGSPTDVDSQDALALVRTSLGDALLASNDRAGARAVYRAALVVREKIVAASPDDAVRAAALAGLRSKLSRLK